jgi:hypothetical protein
MQDPQKYPQRPDCNQGQTLVSDRAGEQYDQGYMKQPGETRAYTGGRLGEGPQTLNRTIPQTPEERIREMFRYHPIRSTEQAQLYELLREDFGNLAVRLNRLLPPNTHREQVIEGLSQILMMANRCIALE